ncbi:MAG: LysM peptidoglycan-binding domain-containing protein [Bacillota bacterium]
MRRVVGLLIIMLLLFYIVGVEAQTLGRTYYEVTPEHESYLQYIIKPGDTFSHLAAKFNVSVEELRKLNPNLEATKLAVGEDIRIRINDKLDYYIIQPDDTLWGLSQRHNFNLRRIINYNDLINPDYLQSREVILLPEDIFVAKNEALKLIEFKKRDGKVRISGLARVFEATVNYAIETKDGQTLEDGFTTASSGAPAWGSFVINLSKLSNEADYIVLFSVDMRDGSRQNEIKLQL